jgi:hypothetical protein
LHIISIKRLLPNIALLPDMVDYLLSIYCAVSTYVDQDGEGYLWIPFTVAFKRLFLI